MFLSGRTSPRGLYPSLESIRRILLALPHHGLQGHAEPGCFFVVVVFNECQCVKKKMVSF